MSSVGGQKTEAERLADDCEEMAEILHEKGEHELADAFEAVAEVKRGDR